MKRTIAVIAVLSSALALIPEAGAHENRTIQPTWFGAGDMRSCNVYFPGQTSSCTASASAATGAFSLTSAAATAMDGTLAGQQDASAEAAFTAIDMVQQPVASVAYTLVIDGVSASASRTGAIGGPEKWNPFFGYSVADVWVSAYHRACPNCYAYEHTWTALSWDEPTFSGPLRITLLLRNWSGGLVPAGGVEIDVELQTYATVGQNFLFGAVLPATGRAQATFEGTLSRIDVHEFE